MKYALIGAGRIAPSHIGAALRNGLEIVAVCDVVPGKSEELIAQFPQAKADSIKYYTDYKQMIDENELDLVAVATVSGYHHDIAKYCISHNINTLLEKPFSMNIPDAEELLALAKEHNVTIGICHEFPFYHASQELKKAVAAGRFGQISHIVANARYNKRKSYYDQADWRGRWATDGGTIMNQGIHTLDKIRWFMGDDALTEVYAVTRQQFHHYIQGEDLGLATFKFASGAIGSVEITSNAYPGTGLETISIMGSKGTATITGNKVLVWKFDEELPGDDAIRAIDEQLEPESAYDYYGNGHNRLYTNFINAMNTRCDPQSSGLRGRNSMEFVLAIYKSMKEGVPVKLPLTDFYSTDMDGTFDALHDDNATYPNNF